MATLSVCYVLLILSVAAWLDVKESGAISPPSIEIGNRYAVFKPSHLTALLSRFFSAAVSGSSIMAAQPDHFFILSPGSRQWLKFASDRTVTCLHNPYQHKCRQGRIDWYQEQYYYHKNPVYESMWLKPNISRLSCGNFYNKSDDKPPWWQQLRQNVLLGITETDSRESPIVLSTKASACTANSHSIANFRVYWKADTEKKYVEWNRAPQSQNNANDMQSMRVCYLNDGRNKSLHNYDYIAMVHAVFTDCLWHYGQIAENRARPSTYAQSGT